MAAENMILSQLGWKLAVPVVLDFVLAYAKVLGLPENHEVLWMMRYIAELGLQTQIYLSYRPSMIAASVVALSCFCLPTEGVGLWPVSLESESGYAWHILEDCTLALCRAIEEARATMPDLSMVFRRYRKPSRANVAGFAVPSIQSFATLTSFRERHVTA
jgi:Cyclin, C-terminal domain